MNGVPERDGQPAETVDRRMLADAYPEMDAEWVDGQLSDVTRNAKDIARRTRRRRRWYLLRRLPKTSAAGRATAVVRLAFGLLGVVSVVLGYIGLRAFAPAADPLDLIYYDLQLFVLGADPLQSGGPYPAALEIARFTAPLVTLYAVVETGRVLFKNELRRALRRPLRNHIVVCGHSMLAQAIATRARATGQAVVTIDAVATAHQEGTHIIGDPRDPGVLERARVAHAARLFAVDQDDAANVAIAVLAAGRSRADGKRLDIYASVQDAELLDSLNARRVAADASSAARVEFFNADALAADILADAELPNLSRTSSPHIVMAGQGPFAVAFAVELGRRWLSESGPHRLRMTLVDPAATDSGPTILRRLPALPAACELELVDADFETWVRTAPSAGPDVRSYICYTDPTRALRAAFAATPLWRSPESILVRLDGFSLFGIDLSGPNIGVFDSATDAVRPFGVLDTAAGADIAEHTGSQRLARAIHANELRRLRRESTTAEASDNPVDAPWHRLPEHLRSDYVHRARAIPGALQALGVVAMSDRGESHGLELDPDDVERLAVLEHQRWVAERRHQGWQYGQRDDVRRRHPDLVAWDQVSETGRERAREAVRAMIDMLADEGYLLTRIGDTQMR